MPTVFKSLGLRWGTEPIDELQCESCGVKFCILIADEADDCPDYCPRCGVKNSTIGAVNALDSKAS